MTIEHLHPIDTFDDSDPLDWIFEQAALQLAEQGNTDETVADVEADRVSVTEPMNPADDIDISVPLITQPIPTSVYDQDIDDSEVTKAQETNRLGSLISRARDALSQAQQTASARTIERVATVEPAVYAIPADPGLTIAQRSEQQRAAYGTANPARTMPLLGQIEPPRLEGQPLALPPAERITTESEGMRRVRELSRLYITEINNCNVFSELELGTTPFARIAALITARARAYGMQHSFVIDPTQITFNVQPAGIDTSGHELIHALLSGTVDTNETFRTQLKADIDEALRAKGHKLTRRNKSVDLLAHFSSDEMWEVMAASVRATARESSFWAHADFFYNVTTDQDGLPRHLDPESKVLATPMQVDFDRFTAEVGLDESDVPKHSATEFCISVSLDQKKPGALDKIIEAAGGIDSGNIQNVFEYDHAAFLGLIPPRDTSVINPGGPGGYLLFGYNQLVPGYPRNNAAANLKVPISNTCDRNISAQGQGDAALYKASVWQLTLEGYTWIQNALYTAEPVEPFVDPRQALRKARNTAAADIERKRTENEVVMSQYREHQAIALRRIVSVGTLEDTQEFQMPPPPPDHGIVSRELANLVSLCYLINPPVLSPPLQDARPLPPPMNNIRPEATSVTNNPFSRPPVPLGPPSGPMHVLPTNDAEISLPKF